MSGSANAVVRKLSDQYGTTVRIPLPDAAATISSEKPLALDMANRAKLMVSGYRTGAAINGTMVNTMAGQGAIYLANMLRVSAGSATVPLTYANCSRTRRWLPPPTCASPTSTAAGTPSTLWSSRIATRCSRTPNSSWASGPRARGRCARPTTVSSTSTAPR